MEKTKKVTKMKTLTRDGIPSSNMFGSRWAILFPDRSMVSSFGNDVNASRGKLSIELSASDKYSSEPSKPANEFNSMQSI